MNPVSHDALSRLRGGELVRSWTTNDSCRKRSWKWRCNRHTTDMASIQGRISHNITMIVHIYYPYRGVGSGRQPLLGTLINDSHTRYAGIRVLERRKVNSRQSRRSIWLRLDGFVSLLCGTILIIVEIRWDCISYHSTFHPSL